MSGFECGGVVVVYSGKSGGNGGLLGEEGGGFGSWHYVWFLVFVVVWKLCLTDVRYYNSRIRIEKDVTCGFAYVLAKLLRLCPLIGDGRSRWWGGGGEEGTLTFRNRA